MRLWYIKICCDFKSQKHAEQYVEDIKNKKRYQKKGYYTTVSDITIYNNNSDLLPVSLECMIQYDKKYY